MKQNADTFNGRILIFKYLSGSWMPSLLCGSESLNSTVNGNPMRYCDAFFYPGHQDKLGVAETKLLHTLHWMLLEAPQDCSSDRFGGDRGSSWGGSGSAFIHQAENQGSPGHPQPSTTNDEEENNTRKFFQNSMATVELFVFLFAPLVHRIKVSGTLMGYLCGDSSEQEKNDSAFVIVI